MSTCPDFLQKQTKIQTFNIKSCVRLCAGPICWTDCVRWGVNWSIRNNLQFKRLIFHETSIGNTISRVSHISTGYLAVNERKTSAQTRQNEKTGNYIWTFISTTKKSVSERPNKRLTIEIDHHTRKTKEVVCFLYSALNLSTNNRNNVNNRVTEWLSKFPNLLM